jgi:hypothetical protein
LDGYNCEELRVTKSGAIRNFLLKFMVLVSFGIGSPAPASAGQTALQALIADYQQQCDKFQTKIVPGIDDDPSASSPKGILSIDDASVYEIEIAGDGKLESGLTTNR